jgi:hypothetical protein
MFDKVRAEPGLPRVVALEAGAATGVVARSIRLRWLWWAAFLLLGLSTGAVGWTIWELRADAVRAAISNS